MIASMKEKIDDLLSWGQEIWHVLAARALGVPRWAMRVKCDEIEIPYQSSQVNSG